MALIEIGSRKQLFVDDYLIESMTNTRQVMTPAVKVEHNPIIRPEYAWEGNHVRGGHPVWDADEQHFKMRYWGRTFHARQGKGEVIVEGERGGVTCLATSKDGIHWDKPTLGLVEYKGSKDNNIIPKEWLMGYSFLDEHETDPARRWKGHVRTGDTTTPGMTFDLYYSPDGMKWTPYENNPIIDTSPRIGRWGPTQFMGWDSIRKVYAVHLENSLHRRSPMGKRLIGRAESPDGIVWSDPETIIIPDEKDPPDTEFYSMACITPFICLVGRQGCQEGQRSRGGGWRRRGRERGRGLGHLCLHRCESGHRRRVPRVQCSAG